MRTLVLLSLLCPMVSFGMDRLGALSMIETGDNDRMVGSAGEISRYQILKSEWRSVTNSTRYADPVTAKAVAEKLLSKRVQQFRAIYHRNPSDFEFYALWNAPAQVLEGRISKRVAERCRRYANLCEWNGAPTRPASLDQPKVARAGLSQVKSSKSPAI
jgi:hypothetical protein